MTKGNLRYLSEITVSDIQDAYDFKRNGVTLQVIVQKRLVARLIRIEDVYGDVSAVHVVYAVDITLRDGTTVLDNRYGGAAEIRRELYPRTKLIKPFCATGTPVLGKVVVNVMFCLQQQFRKKGIASVIYDLEEKLYRQWGAKEIHLHAVDDGRVVWPKRGFVLDCIHEGHVDYFYQVWCERRSTRYAPVSKIQDYPEEFLSSELIKGFRLYKEM